MRADAMVRRFEILLVTDTTRLARSQELAPLIDRMRFQGVRVIGVQDSFDSDAGTADMQAGLSGIMSVEFRRMVRARTYSALESRAKERKPTGGRAYGYRAGEAPIILEIFERFSDGAGCHAIADELNRRKVPSPGSTWRREVRRCSGWMASAIRAILLNPRYRGAVTWNRYEWRKDPDSGRRLRTLRHESAWITHQIESQRLVSDELWFAAQKRLNRSAHDKRLKRGGGKPRYLLSGLLVCAECGAHYILADRIKYACSSYIGGKACHNHVWVRRDRLEDLLVKPLTDRLSRVYAEQMAAEVTGLYAEALREREQRAEEVPQELAAIDARIERLREWLRIGHADLTPDELAAALTVAEGKRRELAMTSAQDPEVPRALSKLPDVADRYRRLLVAGLSGDPEAAARARTILGDLFGGKIRLIPDAAGGLTAHWKFCREALVRGTGTRGSGGRI